MDNENKNEFVTDCQKVDRGELSLEALCTKYFKRKYINIRVKEIVSHWVEDTISSIYNLEDYEHLNISDVLFHYEIIKKNLILNQYVDIDIDSTDVNIYDLSHSIGLINKLTEYTNGDYECFDKIIDTFTGINYINLCNSLNQSMSQIPNIQETDEIISAIKNIDENKLKDLVKLQEFNNPIVGDMIKIIEQELTTNQ